MDQQRKDEAKDREVMEEKSTSIKVSLLNVFH